MKNTVTVLGAGAWGTAVATVLAYNGHDVVLWCYEEVVAHDINTSHCNKRYLPEVTLAKNIHATHDLQEAVQASTWLFEAVPVTCLRSVMTTARPWVTAHHRLVMLSKGVEVDTMQLPVSMLAQLLGEQDRIAVVSGPNFAKELAQQVPTATVIAANLPALAQEVTVLLGNHYFKTVISEDVQGVQVGGAFKNVIALILGMVNGAQYRENTTAYALTQGMQEMVQIAQAFGGKPETIYGLAGFGDLVLCCTGSLSRNFKIGQQLGQGCCLSDFAAKNPVLPEGVNTLAAIQAIAQRHTLNVPLCSAAYEVVYQGKPIDAILQRLMA